MDSGKFEERLERHTKKIHPIVPLETGEILLQVDLTAGNDELNPEIFSDTETFSHWISHLLQSRQAKYGIGGYNEHRTVYARSAVFDSPGESRRLHLGIDIWGPAGTPVSAPVEGEVHSFANNDAYGDYGATIILKHQINDLVFHTLYGHLSLNSIDGIRGGDLIPGGKVFAWFGIPAENGHWPPHLHFQVIMDMEGMKGDYPGVCKYSERKKYLNNCPDPSVLLGLKVS